MTYLVVGAGDHSKSPARFTDVVQACDYAAALARAGLGTSVYVEITSYTATPAEKEG